MGFFLFQNQKMCYNDSREKYFVPPMPRQRRIYAMTRQFALIGHPLGHSLSPLLHRSLFRLAGRSGSYELAELSPEVFELPETARLLRGLDGFNVTIPYKTDIIPLLDRLDDSAAFYGAVNTVTNRDGLLIGSNTDAAGFVLALKAAGVDLLPGGRVCVVGAGGAGRTLALEAGRRGAAVTLAVRPTSLQRAGALADEMARKGFSAQVCPVEALQGGWDLLVNASPAGMFPHTDAMPVAPAALEGTATVFDAVYNPAETLLLHTAARFGCRCVGGMAMLAWQGAEAHRLWDGDRFSAADIDNLIRELYGALAPSPKPAEEELQP